MHRLPINIKKLSVRYSLKVSYTLKSNENGYGLGLRDYKGYVCRSKDEILTAYDRLTAELGHTNVAIKDCFGAGGDDISLSDDDWISSLYE